MERSTTPSSERSTASQEYALYYNRSTLPNEPLTVDVNISQASVKMEIDTGATITLMSEHSYKELWNEQNRSCLRPAEVIVHTYTSEQVGVKRHNYSASEIHAARSVSTTAYRKRKWTNIAWP